MAKGREHHLAESPNLWPLTPKPTHSLRNEKDELANIPGSQS